MIRFNCASCGHAFSVADDAAGRVGKCNRCGHPNRVPALAPPTPLPSASPPPIAPPAAKAARQPKGLSKTLLTIIAVIAGFVCGASAGYWAGRATNAEAIARVPSSPATAAIPEPSAKPTPTPKPAPEPPAAAKAKPAPPTPVDFQIQGMKIGDPLTEEFAYSHCPAKDKGKPDIDGSEIIKLSGGEIFVSYHFRASRLAWVSILFDSKLYPALVLSYTEKFGTPPHSVEREPVRTNAGVEHINEISTWITHDGPFTIRKFGSNITDGWAELETAANIQATKDSVRSQIDTLKGKL